MSGTPGMTMDEQEEAEENLLLSCEDEEGPVDSTVVDDVDETAEDLMTDMRLDDEMDEVRATEPDFHWTYHIEIYPWTAEDMTENFVRLLKLADFSQIYMRKKGACKENGEPESVDDKLQDRQRKGSIHFYTASCQNAKNIIRSSTWKAMVSKQLTFEITKRGSDYGSVESAYLEVDTYTACKCRYRDRPKGDFKDRSAKVSSIPGTISREFLDVIFCRAYAVIGGSTVKEYYKERNDNLQQKLSQIKDFDGSLDFDCLSRGSCRAFVTSHKNVYIEGQRISIAANNEEIMTVPPPADISVAPPSSEDAPVKQELPEHIQESPAGVPNQNVSVLRRILQLGSLGSSRGRGPSRILLVPQRPTNVNVTRAGPGMPVPMTGRQKMNEKLRRNQTQTSGPPVSSSNPGGSGGPSGYRGTIAASIGETFKQEIAALQIQLQQNTAELQAKIAQLQESNAALLHAEHSDWGEGVYLDDEEYYDDALGSSGDYGQMKMTFPSFNSATLQPNYNFNMMPGSPMSMPGMSTHAGSGGLLPHPISSNQMSQVGPGNLATNHLMQPPMSGVMQMPGQMMQQNAAGQMSQPFSGHMSPGMAGQVFQAMPGQMSQSVAGHAHQSASGYMSPNQIPMQMNQSFPGQMLFSSNNNNQMPSGGPAQASQSGGQGQFVQFAPGSTGLEHFRHQRGGASRGRPKTRGGGQGFGQGWRRGDGDV